MGPLNKLWRLQTTYNSHTQILHQKTQKLPKYKVLTRITRDLSLFWKDPFRRNVIPLQKPARAVELVLLTCTCNTPKYQTKFKCFRHHQGSNIVWKSSKLFHCNTTWQSSKNKTSITRTSQRKQKWNIRENAQFRSGSLYQNESFPQISWKSIQNILRNSTKRPKKWKKYKPNQLQRDCHFHPQCCRPTFSCKYVRLSCVICDKLTYLLFRKSHTISYQWSTVTTSVCCIISLISYQRKVMKLETNVPAY